MRLIDADKLIALWYEINDIDKDDRGARFVGYTEIVRMINSIPTTDAVEVVRCENCKHCMTTDYFTSADEKYVTLYHCKLNDNILKTNDDYCSYGERREE